MATRGSTNPRYSSSRCAMWINGNHENLTVAQDVGGMDSNNDGICIALIQPVTQEMRERNEKSRMELKDKIAEALAPMHGCTRPAWGHQRNFEDMTKALSSIATDPILMIYNFDFYDNPWKSITLYDKLEKSVKVMPTNYQMTGESWSSPGGPLHWKYYFGCIPDYHTYNLGMLQIIY